MSCATMPILLLFFALQNIGRLSAAVPVDSGIMTNKIEWFCNQWLYSAKNPSYSVCSKDPCSLEGDLLIPIMSGSEDHYYFNLTAKWQLSFYDSYSRSTKQCKDFLRLKVHLNFTNADPGKGSGKKPSIIREHSSIIPVNHPVKPSNSMSTSVVLNINSLLVELNAASSFCYFARLKITLEAIGKCFCGSLNDVDVLSSFCPSLKIRLTQYPKLTAGSKDEIVKGTCVANAKNTATDLPEATCTKNGVYRNFISSCQCIDQYKEQNGECVLDCPANSTLSTEKSRCDCNPGFYRRYGKEREAIADCTAPEDFEPCPNVQSVSSDGEIIIFEQTYVYSNVTIQCNRRTNNPLNVTRECQMSKNSTGVWDIFNSTGCGRNPQFCSTVSAIVKSTGEVLVFSDTLVNEHSVVSCKQKTVNITRKCIISDVSNKKPVWENITFDDCQVIRCPFTTEIVPSTNETVFFNETIAGGNFTGSCKKHRKNASTPAVELTRKCVLGSDKTTARWENITLDRCDDVICLRENIMYKDAHNKTKVIVFNNTYVGDIVQILCEVNDTYSETISRKCVQKSTKTAEWEILDLTPCGVLKQKCKHEERLVTTTNETLIFRETVAGESFTTQCRSNTTNPLNVSRACILTSSTTADWADINLDKCQQMCPSEESIVKGTNEKLIFNKTKAGENFTLKCRNQTKKPVSIVWKCVWTNATTAVWLKETLDVCRVTCPSVTEILNTTNEELVFNETDVGEHFKVYCKGAIQDFVTVTRECLYDERNASGTWQVIDFSECLEESTISIETLLKKNITNDTVAKASELLVTLTADTASINTSRQVDDVTSIIENILNIDNQNETINQNIFQSIDNILNINRNLLRNFSDINNAVLSIFDIIAEGVLDNPIEFSGANFGFASSNQDKLSNGTFVNVSLSNNEIGGKSTNKSSNGVQLEYSTASTPNVFGAAAQLFVPLSAFMENHLKRANIYSYAFKNDWCFPYQNKTIQNKGDEKLNTAYDEVLGKVDSFILGTTIYNTTIRNLSTPIEITFKVTGTEKQARNGICAFWNLSDLDNGRSYWSKGGCVKSRVFSEGNFHYVTCECNHLTNFAMLLNVYDEEHSKDDTSDAMNIASLIGCSISIVSLIATLVFYAGLRELRSRVAQKIIINFSLSLLFLLLTFLFGVDESFTKVFHAHKKTPTACHVVASLVHAFILSTFLWMAIQAIFLYKKSVRATKNRGESKRTYQVCFWMAWGVSGITAGVTSVFTKSQFKTATVCIMRGNMFYYTTLVPVSCIILVNFLLFLPIIKTIHDHFKFSASAHKHHKNQLWKRTKVTISCTTFLGLTWMFAFFSVKDVRTIFQWVFVIFNALQGFLLFIFYVLLNDKVLNAWKLRLRNKKKKTSTTTSTGNLIAMNNNSTTTMNEKQTKGDSTM